VLLPTCRELHVLLLLLLLLLAMLLLRPGCPTAAAPATCTAR
jgi:hypothetical protein